MDSVTLLHSTPFPLAIVAIRTCWDSFEKSDSYWSTIKDLSTYNEPVFVLGEKDESLIRRVLEMNHESTIEHLSFTFSIKGMSRLVLQELARHRIASLSVKSTRYTLKELKGEDEFVYPRDIDRIKKYINLTADINVNIAAVSSLEQLRKLICINNINNDVVKYALPECYKTDLVLTMNARSLRNFFNLRLSSAAHFEIRELARMMLNVIPKEYNILFDKYNKE